MPSPRHQLPLRLAVAGKGGAGKSVIAATLARLLARRGADVLALDSDLMPGLALSLGAGPRPEAMLADAAEQGENGRWRLRRGIGPVRAVRRYALEAPDGVRLLQAGKLGADGLPAIMGSITAFYRVIHRIADAPAFSDWCLIGDLPAGPRHPAFDWAPYAETLLLVVEPGWQSVLAGRRVAGIARARGAEVLLVASKTEGEADIDRVGELLGAPVFAAVPLDPAVAEAERLGRAAIDHAPEGAAVAAIKGLADRLLTRSIEGVSAA